MEGGRVYVKPKPLYGAHIQNFTYFDLARVEHFTSEALTISKSRVLPPLTIRRTQYDNQ